MKNFTILYTKYMENFEAITKFGLKKKYFYFTSSRTYLNFFKFQLVPHENPSYDCKWISD